MSQKTALTILHGVIAAGVTISGMKWAGSIAPEHPGAALVVLVAAAVTPALIATRVAWASGFEAGRRATGALPPDRFVR